MLLRALLRVFHISVVGRQDSGVACPSKLHPTRPPHRPIIRSIDGSKGVSRIDETEEIEGIRGNRYEEEAWESCGRPCEKVGSDDPRRMGEEECGLTKERLERRIREQKERE